MELFGDCLETPVGKLTVLGSATGTLHRIWFGAELPAAPGISISWDPAPCRRAVEQLQQYFDGNREVFDLELALAGSDFQLRVWRELQRIPFGTTIGYGELASRLGDPGAVRAVGGANHGNPIPIVIPCHRVIGADGSLVGFGGGLEIKRQLLLHEGFYLL